jgi:hypothetical protein
MKKLLLATAISFAAAAALSPVHAQVGKAVNNVKSDYHNKRSKQSAENAKESLKKATE